MEEDFKNVECKILIEKRKGENKGDVKIVGKSKDVLNVFLILVDNISDATKLSKKELVDLIKFADKFEKRRK